MALTASELAILVSAKDQASATLKKMQRETKTTGTVFAALGKAAKVAGVAMAAAAAAGIAVMTKALYDSVQAASEAEQIQAGLVAVLRSTQHAAGLSSAEINNMALSLSTMTRFEDDAIVAGQSLLLTFTNIGRDVFPQATEMMLNMSTVLGTDLPSSARMLGRALNDPTQGLAALTRVGVTFSQKQEDQIKALQESGKLMEAQKLILAALEVKFGGAAKAAGQTFAGQLDILNNAVGNLKEAVGEPLLKPLTAVVGKFIEFATRKDIVQAAADVGQFFGNIAEKAVPPLIEGLSNVVQFGRRAIGTISDIVDILSGSYQDDMALNFFGQPTGDYVPSMAQRLSDAIRNGDWSAVGEAMLAKGAEMAAALVNGITSSIVITPDDAIAMAQAVVTPEFKAKVIENSYASGREAAAGWQLGFKDFFQSREVGGWLTQASQDIGLMLVKMYVQIEQYYRTVQTKGLGAAISDMFKRAFNGAEDSVIGMGMGMAASFVKGIAAQLGISESIDRVYNAIASLWNAAYNALPDLAKKGMTMLGIGTIQLRQLGVGGGSPLPDYVGQAPGYASGGYFKVPEGFPNDSFPILVQSGEHVAVWPRGMEPPKFDTGYYPNNYQPGPVPSGGTASGGSAAPTQSYSGPGSMLGLAGLPGYQMQGGPPGVTGNSTNGPSAAQMFAAAWPAALMSAGASNYQSVGVGWVDAILRGMNNQAQSIGGNVQGTLNSTFKRWWTALKTSGGELGGNIRRQVENWMGDWFSIATTSAGENIGSIAERMLDTLVQTGGHAVSTIVSQNRGLFMSLLGGSAGTLVGGAFSGIDALLGLGGTFGNVGGAAASMYEQRIVQPMREQLAILEQQGTQLAEIRRIKREIAVAEERMLALQKAQQDLQWLEAQLDLVRLVKENGLSGSILSGLQFGTSANPAAFLQAMTSAITQLATGVQGQMGALGVPIAAAPRTESTTINLTANYKHQPAGNLTDDVKLLQMVYG